MARRSWRALASLAAVLLVGAGLPAAGAPTPAATVTVALDALPAGPIPSPRPFSLVGVDLPPGVDAAVRSSADGRRWSSWFPLEPQRGGSGPSEPVWTGAARWLELRGLPATTPVRLHLIDTLSAGAHTIDEVGTARAHAALWRPGPSRPPIVSRRSWGADERLRRGAPEEARAVRAAIVHHTAGGNTYSRAQAPAVLRAIYAYHTRVLGWDDIGYNLLVDRYGRIFEGRAGGVERPVIGAHARGFNTGTTGVAVLGSFEGARPPEPALGALADVLAWKAHVHGFDPRGTAVFTSGGSTRYPRGTKVRLAAISGHRDVSRTACPGAALYAYLPRLREQVADRAGDGPLPALPAPLGMTAGGLTARAG